MGARNGVTAVGMVQAGLSGVPDVLDGTHNLLIALSTEPRPEAMVEGLGSRFFVTETAIKAYSVGYPIQSALDAFLTLRKQNGLEPDKVAGILVKLPTDAVGIVGESAMPDVNCRHMVAVALVKGAVSFADSHDGALMHDPKILAQRDKITVVASPGIADFGAWLEQLVAESTGKQGKGLIPVDAELKTDLDTEQEAISLRSVMLMVSAASNDTTLPPTTGGRATTANFIPGTATSCPYIALPTVMSNRSTSGTLPLPM